MSGTSFNIEIVTPEKEIYRGEATEMVLPASDGLMGILPNHAPIVAALDVGRVSVKRVDGGQDLMMISDGFFEMANNSARILADVGERREDIDVERARRAEERARKRLAMKAGDKSHDIDYIRVERSLQRAIWRLQIASGENQ
ncbi:MAG: F-type H+-transporting ATPase subunit epsilon [Planctomycetota bacterium]